MEFAGRFGDGTTPLGLAWDPAGDCRGAPEGAGQVSEPQAMNPLVATVDLVAAPVPYQQMMTMVPRTPVPITRLRTERGRRKSWSCGIRCSSVFFSALAMAISY